MKWNDYRRNSQYITRGSFDYLPAPAWNPDPNYKPTWTLAEEDHDGLYSFKKWYLKFYQDPTEVNFVNTCFEGDWKHWEVFKNSRELKDMCANLKRQAEKMLLADVMNRIVQTAMDSDNKASITALKYLADRGFKALEGPVNKGGRPKKEKKAEEVDSKSLLADIARLKE